MDKWLSLVQSLGAHGSSAEGTVKAESLGIAVADKKGEESMIVQSENLGTITLFLVKDSPGREKDRQKGKKTRMAELASLFLFVRILNTPQHLNAQSAILLSLLLQYPRIAFEVQ